MTDDERRGVVEVWADIVCPFAHVGLRRITTARDARSHPARLWVRAWPLELVNGEPMRADAVAEKVAVLRDTVAPDLFAGFDEAGWPETSLPALALTAVAYDHDMRAGEGVAMAIRTRLFEDGLDVSDRDVLSSLASEYGLDVPSSATSALADYAAGRARGVRGSPHFFVDGDDSFCPSLDIRHGDDGLLVRFDGAGFDAFTDVAFR